MENEIASTLSAVGVDPGMVDKLTRTDGWVNTETGFSADKGETRGFLRNRLIDARELVNAYYGDDLTETAVAAIVEDSLREPPVVNHPKATPEQIKAVETALTDLCFVEKVREGAIFGRLLGDSFLWSATEGPQNQRPRKGEKVLFLKSLDRRLLVPCEYEANPLRARFGFPSVYQVTPVGLQVGATSSANARVHFSRGAWFSGTKLDLLSLAENAGWNLSILQRAFGLLADMGDTWGAITELLQQISVGLLKIKGLKAMRSQNRGDVEARLKATRASVSVHRLVAIDADAEDFTRLEVGALTGAAALLEQVLLRAASAVKMPLTRLYGRAPSGLNATGEADAENWASRVESWRTENLVPQMTRLLNEIAAGLLPEVSSEWCFEMPSVRTESTAVKNANAKAVADIDELYLRNQVFEPWQIAKLRGGPGGSFTLGYTKIDVSTEASLEAALEAYGPGGDTTPPGPSSEPLTDPVGASSGQGT